MKRTWSNRYILSFLCALLGFAIGLGVYYAFLRTPPPDSSSRTGPEETLSRIEMAMAVSSALYGGDYQTLSTWVSPDKGLAVVPFSTVGPATGVTLSAAEVRDVPSLQTRPFGVNPDDDAPIMLPPAEFFEAYMRTVDFSKAPVIGINRVIMRGNAVENIAEAFPGCEFIDLYYPPSEPALGTDWISMKVVLEPRDEVYTLVALVRGVYTLQ